MLVITTTTIYPWQLTPSPSCPTLQAQVNEPTLFWQVALAWQLSSDLEHSFTSVSVKKKERELILFKQRNNNKNDGKNKPNEISNSINNDRIVRVIVIVMVMHGNSNNDNDNNISNSNSNNSKNYPDCRNPPLYPWGQTQT